MSKYTNWYGVALERFPLPDNADEMGDTARVKHAYKLSGSKSKGGGKNKLKPEEVARRLRIGKLYHEFKYCCRFPGSPSKRDQFLLEHPDCVLGERLMTTAVAAYKKQAKKQ